MINAVKEFFNEINQITEIMHAVLTIQDLGDLGIF